MVYSQLAKILDSVVGHDVSVTIRLLVHALELNLPHAANCHARNLVRLTGEMRQAAEERDAIAEVFTEGIVGRV